MNRQPRCVILFAVMPLAVSLAAACTSTASDPAPTPTAPLTPAPGPTRDASMPVDEQVEVLLGQMTLADKVGQMTQAERSVVEPADVTGYRLGSVLSGGGSGPRDGTPQGWADMIDGLQEAATAAPAGIPLLYGADAVHGHNNVYGATIFPHNIGLGAAGDPDLVERIAQATAAEMAATGVSWNFAPCLAVVQDTRWGRSYESFGSDPALVASMTSAVTGYQDAGILATAKHYLADGGTQNGQDQGDAQIDEATLRAIHLPAYQAAVERGVGSVMVSFSSWNGQKMHANEYLITEVLKGELGFEGFVVSDWAGIDQIDGATGLSHEDVVSAINAGVDMVMVPYEYQQFIALLTEAVESGEVPMARIDDAVSRILAAKIRIGLFEAGPVDRSLADQVGSDEHRALAREAVARSLVVLRNDDDVLPLEDDAQILVMGDTADDIGNQAGGWTLSWQGRSGADVIPGTTILAGLQEVVDTTYSPTGTSSGSADDDVAIAVVGETPYAEFEGDRTNGVVFSESDLAVLEELHEADAVTSTVIVVVSGRPIDLSAYTWADAIVAAWLPGSEGAGVADVLTGAVVPAGRLPVGWGEWPVGYAWEGEWD